MYSFRGDFWRVREKNRPRSAGFLGLWRKKMSADCETRWEMAEK